jgi:hypothetical protein
MEREEHKGYAKAAHNKGECYSTESLFITLIFQ